MRYPPERPVLSYRTQQLNSAGTGDLELTDAYNEHHGTFRSSPLPEALLEEAMQYYFEARPAGKRH